MFIKKLSETARECDLLLNFVETKSVSLYSYTEILKVSFLLIQKSKKLQYSIRLSTFK